MKIMEIGRDIQGTRQITITTGCCSCGGDFYGVHAPLTEEAINENRTILNI